jgi:predicted transcriptional regulator
MAEMIAAVIAETRQVELMVIAKRRSEILPIQNGAVVVSNQQARQSYTDKIKELNLIAKLAELIEIEKQLNDMPVYFANVYEEDKTVIPSVRGDFVAYDVARPLDDLREAIKAMPDVVKRISQIVSDKHRHITQGL